MATDVDDIIDEIQAIVKDADFQNSGSYEAYITTYLNDFQVKYCTLIDVDRHRTTGTVTAAVDAFNVDMPTNFLKLSDTTKVYVGTNDYHIPIVTLEELNIIDPDHSETTTASSGPQLVAFHGNKLYYWPMWAGTVTIQDYYRIPTDMVAATASTLDIVSEGIATDKMIRQLAVDYTCEKIYRIWLHQPEKAAMHKIDYKENMAILTGTSTSGSRGDFVNSAY